MAAALGSLVVSLGLDAAEFIGGMTKSEYQAKKFAGTIDRAVAAGVVKAEIAIRSFGAAARLAGDAFQSLTAGAAQFQDLAEITGTSAEAIASLATAAAVGEVGIESIADAINKLNKNLLGVDDESKAAGAALAALNIPIEEFKKLDPVDQYERVGQALEAFTDNNKRAAVAVALFGKAGAEQLKVFKALEEQGGRQIILSQQQIEQADAFADAQTRAKTELQQYAQAAASQAVPAILDLTRVAVDLVKQFLSIDAATGKLATNNGAKEFAVATANALAFLIDAGDGVVRTFQAIGKAYGGGAAVMAAAMSGDFKLAFRIAEEAKADLNAVLDRVTARTLLERQRAASAESARLQAREDRGFDPRPSINFDGATKPSKAKAVSEAQRYLENLQKQLLSTQELSVAETVLADIRSGRLGVVSAAAEREIIAIAKQIDATKEAVRVAGERSDARKKEYDEINEFVRASEEADRSRLKSLTSGTETAMLRAVSDDIAFLNQQFDKGKISAEEWAEAVRDATGRLKKDTEKVKTLAEELGLSFTSAFEDAIVSGGNLRDILKGIEQDIIRIVTRKVVTEPLGKAITDAIGGSGGGGGLLGSITGFIGGLFGGDKANGGPVGSGMYRVAENRPEMLDVNGKQFLLMGNQRGRIDPNPRIGGRGGVSVTNNFTVTGAVDRRTQRQTATMAGQAVQAALARNG